MKALITGASGFLGPYLVRQAQKSGWQVSTVSRNPRHFPGAGIHRDNLASPASRAEEAFKDQDLIIHAAVDYRSPERSRTMTENVVKFSAAAGNPKIIFISSQNASFQNPGGYSLAKKQSEEFLKAHYSRWCIVRPTLIYDDSGGFLIGDLIRIAKRFRVIPLPGRGASAIQPVHAEDVAGITFKAAALPDGTTVTVAGRDVVTLPELARGLQKNIPGSFILTVPMGLLKLAGLLNPVIRDKVNELEQEKTLSPDLERQLSSILSAPRRGILEDLSVIFSGEQTKSDVLRDPGVGIKKEFPVHNKPRLVK